MSDNPDNKSESKNNSQYETFTRRLLWASVMAIVLFSFVTTIIRLLYLSLSVSNDGQSPDPNFVLERANEAVNSVNLVLSFLEGASVLLALAVGAAAIYGFRQYGETRKELEDKLKHIEELSQNISKHIPQLNNLDSLEKKLETSNTSLTNIIANTSRLLQADLEFRLGNHNTAYSFITEVLENDPENQAALYIAGWLETHHIDGKTEDGLEHLGELVQISGKWPSALAAHGVALRRKAMTLRDEKKPYKDLLTRAEGELKVALGQAPNIVDFNRESFWGPVGGILRDLDDIGGAIKAYERALDTTPGSSYPQGNLASLYLHAAKREQSEEKKMLTAFEDTIKSAMSELASTPNDYYLVMDISMAEIILGYKDNKRFGEGDKRLGQSFGFKPTPKKLEVSRRGWQFLYRNIPDRDGWQPVKEAIEEALKKIDEYIDANSHLK
jgi:tetratricopeptide (TPR) repeat protein